MIWAARWNESGRLVSEIGFPDLGTPQGRWLEMEGKVCADLGEAGEAELQRIIPYRDISGRIRCTNQLGCAGKSHLHQSSVIPHL
jgi:hypothetical protein